MRTDTRQRLSFAVRMRMFLRFLGMTAILAAGAGAIYLSSVLPNWKPETLEAALKNELGNTAFYGALLLGGGILIAILAVVIELLASVRGAASGRGSTGFNAAVQKVLAVGLIVAVNVYAFLHPASFDLTSNKQFTLPDKVVADLQTLKSKTTIVVLQQHKTFGQLTGKADHFDYAAERKVVEKVLDTVELFRKFGPQFKVVVLDKEDENFQKKFDEVSKDLPALRDAIDSAPENSIFFYSEGSVQRMSFNEFYRLDKTESKKDRGNLVLHPQGIGAFAKRIVAIQERRPKVALLAMHEALSPEETSEIGLAGMKKTLEEFGFETVDIILKKLHQQQSGYDGEAAALRLNENKLQRLQSEVDDAQRKIRGGDAFLKKLQNIRKEFDRVKDESIVKRSAVYREHAPTLGFRPFIGTLSPEAEQTVREDLKLQLAQTEQKLIDERQELADIEKQLKETRKDERAIEDGRETDVKAKLSRLLSECDLIVVPRYTILDATKDLRVPYGVFRFKEVHVEAVKEFLKAGKPVLVCTGPFNEVDGQDPGQFDDLEKLLAERGVDLGGQTILFDSERKSFAARSAGSLTGSATTVPPIGFQEPKSLADKKPKALAGKKPNPLAEAMNALQLGLDHSLNVRIRAPRPIGVSSDLQEKLSYGGEFIWTDRNGWKEVKPFAEFDRVATPNGMRLVPVYLPQSDPTKAGPVSIGVAFESNSPMFWYARDVWKVAASVPPLGDVEQVVTIIQKLDDFDGQRKSSRIAVIGQASIFSGKQLDPAAERLLLNTCNWLLAREDRLPSTAATPWKYPRVAMTGETKTMWHWGAFLGLPALFVYIGLVVLMLRRVR